MPEPEQPSGSAPQSDPPEGPTTPAPTTTEPDPVTPARSRRVRLVALAVVAALALGATLGYELTRTEDHRPPGAWTLVPYQGLGAWIDVYDWTEEFTGGEPPVGLDDVDAMADAGIQTVYVQVGHHRSAEDVIEPERLEELIDRIHDRGMHAVAWYLPTLVDPVTDLRRLLAASLLDVDGLGVDIEAIDIEDPAERNRRLLALSEELREAVGPDKHLSAITLTALHVEVINPDYWPGYPWAALADTYDSILPMAYWSLRRDDLRSGSTYVGRNIDMIRELSGDPSIPIHPIGGIADEITVADVEGMVDALSERGAVGGSLYDWNTATPELWEAMQALRSLRSDD